MARDADETSSPVRLHSTLIPPTHRNPPSLPLRLQSAFKDGAPTKALEGFLRTLPPPHTHTRSPPLQSAFKDGAPTKALEGFLRKNGVSAADVTRETDAKGVEYCFVTVKDAGRAAAGEWGGGDAKGVEYCFVTVKDAGRAAAGKRGRGRREERGSREGGLRGVWGSRAGQGN